MSSRHERRRGASSAPVVPEPPALGLPPFLTAAVFLASCAAFLPALRNGFVNWDDDRFILNNPVIRGFSWPNIRWMFSAQLEGNYAPLSWLSYALDYSLWGMDPRGFHLTNLVLHGLGAAVFFAVCLKLLRRALPAEDPGRVRRGAAFSALLFSLHPLRVESVVWAAERRDVLCGLFYLLSLLAYLRVHDSSREAGARRSAVPLSLFLLALLSKGMAVSLPLVLIILDFFPLGRLPAEPRRWLEPEPARAWREKIPYLLLSAGFGALGVLSQHRAGAMKSLTALGPGARIAQASFASLFYLVKTLVPAGLSPTYAPRPDMSLQTPLYFLCFLLVVAATALAVRLRRSVPAMLAVWAFYLVVLFPVSGIVNIGGQVAADRYTYLPCLGWALLAGGVFAARADRLPWRVAAAALLAGLSVSTLRQSVVWRDSETLWKRSMSLDPRLLLPRINLGEAYVSQGRFDEAAAQYRAALDLNPRDADALAGLGVARMRQGRAADAVELYRAALEAAPGAVETRSNLCAALCALDRLDDARRECDRAAALDPRRKGVHLNLGVIAAKQGRLDEAIVRFRTALEIDPGYQEARSNLDRALALYASSPR